jgi:hypothetical protein
MGHTSRAEVWTNSSTISFSDADGADYFDPFSANSFLGTYQADSMMAQNLTNENAGEDSFGESPRASEDLVQLSEAIAFWIHRVLVPAVTLFGIAGNCSTIRLMTRNRRVLEGPTRLYLTALATADLLYLVFSSALSLFHLPNVNHPRYLYYWKCRPYGLWLTDSSSKRKPQINYLSIRVPEESSGMRFGADEGAFVSFS